MPFFDKELTLLSEKKIRGFNGNGIGQLDVLHKYGTKAAVTDLVILMEGYYKTYTVPDDNTLKGRTTRWWTSTPFHDSVVSIMEDGSSYPHYRFTRGCAIRPVLQLSPILFSQISKNRVSGYNGTEEVEYGEYPQYAPVSRMQRRLEKEYQRGNLRTTGRDYTFDRVRDNGFQIPFKPEKYEEYEYQGRRYIRVQIRSDHYESEYKLSNGVNYIDRDNVWIEVSPVVWLIDDRTKTLVSKRALLSGVRFHTHERDYNGDFKTTEMKEYLDTYMLHDLTQSEVFTRIDDKEGKKVNPYGLKFEQVSEEDIIKGAVESGIAVFLHGPSSEGKSARVKQIDPTCEIIYLRNATPESLNGKSVYNGDTGEMIDVKPSWLRKLEEKCEAEPDRFHIVFFDEITNALPSIQGIAFNIVLNREVNGIWELPENARIVAAGNDMKDSLAANQLAEPLFNRFAHVYIKTTPESWLKWASENNIHPAIYAYIAYKRDSALRSKYDGEKPNADPRKWEMASKMLYATGNPEMLRSLVGEEITREFVQFCNQQVITLDDVINGNYRDRDIQALNTAERYATIMGLSQVDEINLEKVREFVTKLGAEFTSIFDELWTHGEESRLEILAEIKLAKMSEGGKIR